MSCNISKEKEKTDKEIADMKHPFEDDLLERKEIAETIANIISNTKSSYVYNINSPYGTGKTFFLKRLKCLLENKGCKVILYNSWENDLLENPFIPLTQEIINALNDEKLSQIKDKKFIKAFGEAAAEVISNHNIITKIAYKTYKNVKEETKILLQQYKQIKDLISRFKESFANIANPKTLIVIIIDELDRCRPDYAVKTLETIKHFFDIDNVIFVLAMDREQIKSTISVLYGVNIEKNSSEYLRKFIDQDFYLPKPNSEKYLKFLCKKHLKEVVYPLCNNPALYRSNLVTVEECKYNEYGLSIRQTYINNLLLEEVLQLITKYLKLTSSYYGFSLRAQEQLVKKIKIFISSLNSNSDIFAPEIIVIFNSAHLFDKNMFESFKNNKNINYFLLPLKSTNNSIAVQIEEKGGDLSTISKFHDEYNNHNKGEDPINLWSEHINNFNTIEKRGYGNSDDYKLKKISAEVIEKYISLVLLLNILDKTNQE